MSGPQLDPVNTRDQLSEPVREKLQETTISPLRANGEDLEDDGLDSSDMAVQTRAQARQRARNQTEATEAQTSTDLKHKPSVKKSTKDAQPSSANGSANNITSLPQPEASSNSHANGTIRGTTPPALLVDAPMKGMSSPTTGKRGRDDFEDEVALQKKEAEAVPAVVSEAVAKADETQSDTNAERAPKRPRSESPKMAATNTTDTTVVEPALQAPQTSQSTAKIPPTSGFANTSAASPFGTLGKPGISGFGNTSSTSPFGALAGSKSPPSDATKSPPLATSSSAFAASGFGSLAGQTVSPFGSLAKSNGQISSFATATPIAKPGGFGSTTLGGGFAALGGSGAKLGFGSSTPGGGFGALAGGPKLSGFGTASGSSTLPPITGLSSAPAVPFGTPATGKDEDDDEDGSANDPYETGEEGEESSQKEKSSAVPGKSKSESVHITNGEENEETMFTTRAKIYAFVADSDGEKPAWKERGVGVLKVNIDKTSWDEATGRKSPSSSKKDDDEEEEDLEKQAAPTKSRARLVMRADATNRLILNSPIQNGTLFGDKPGAGKTTVMLLGLLQGQDGLQKLQVKMKADLLQEFWDFVRDLQDDGA